MTDPFIGEIRMFAGNYAPKGWAMCDGQLLPLNQNQALFSLLDTAYGGNGVTTFALPDLRGRTPIDQGQGTGLTLRERGNQGGAEAVQLLEEHLPPHTHRPLATTAAGDRIGVSQTWAETGARLYADTPNANMHPGTMAPAGLSHPHNNLAPYLTLTFIIALQGIFPSRT